MSRDVSGASSLREDRAGRATPGAADASPPSGDHPIARFTPPPWRVGEYDQHRDGFEVRANGQVVALAPYLGGTDPALANARLIAAAPELYAQLQAAIVALEAFGVRNGGIPAMRAALAKARGEA